MFPKGFIKRGRIEQDKRAQREADRSDPAYVAKRAEQQKLLFDADAEYRAFKERERLEREGPARSIANLFRERFQNDLPEIYDVMQKSDGMAKVLRLLKPMVEGDLKVRRDKAEAVRIEGDRARMIADGERRVREKAEREAKRKAKAEAETTLAETMEAEA